MPPCLRLRDWYESGKSDHSDQTFSTPHPSTTVSPFHAEPLQALELTGLEMVELFAARFRQEDGFRDLKQRLGWEECRSWTKAPIERTSQAQWVTMSLMRLAQFRLESAGEVDWWFRPPWNKGQGSPECARPGAANAAAQRGNSAVPFGVAGR